MMTMNFKQVLNFSFQFDQKVNQQTKNGLYTSICLYTSIPDRIASLM